MKNTYLPYLLQQVRFCFWVFFFFYVLVGLEADDEIHLYVVPATNLLILFFE